MEKKRILVIEDEKPIAEILKYGFEKEDFVVEYAHTGVEGLERAERFRPHLVLLDWMLPDIAGVDVCRILTERMNIPIIMLTARSNVEDKLYGLESGADDYVTKPFDLREVVARARTILRRFDKVQALPKKDESDGDLTVLEQERVVMRGEKIIELTPKEYNLLLHFIKYPRQVFTRGALLDQIWGYDYVGDTRTVDIHIQRLRRKTGLGDKLVTVFGVGYKYVP